jgi:Trypsin-like peptidase domain
MQHEARDGVAVLALAGVLAACQVSPPAAAPRATTTAAAPSATAHADRSSALPAAPIDWASADGCLSQLRLLHDAAAQGRLEAAHAPPFAVVSTAPTTSLEWIHAPTVQLVLDLPLSSYEDQGEAAAAAPCLLMVEQPSDLRAAHRVIDFQNVASLYQTGVRSERNPDYDAAHARLKEAERESRSGGPDILRVGDPMLDLVGLLVGGVIATFGHLGGGDQLDDALTALKETPRSRDRPVYRAYEFERSTVRAGKEATIPIALRDLRRGHLWRAQLRQREMRQFSVVEGLDPRDRDYEQHRAGAFSWEEFDHWQRQPPQLPVSALVAALVEMRDTEGGAGRNGSELVVDARSSLPPTGSADADDATGSEASSPLAAVAAIEPGAGPGARSWRTSAPFRNAPAAQPLLDAGRSREVAARTGAAVFAAALDPRVASVVRLETGGRRGGGFYVKPRLVVTTADLIGTASVIDVTTSDGEEVLGLVVHTDPARNLAVVHVPRSGLPAVLFAGPALAPADAIDVLELLGQDRARLTPGKLQPAAAGGDGMGTAARFDLDLAGAPVAAGAPVFLNERAAGLVAGQGGGLRRQLVQIDALAALLQSEALTALR